MPNNIHDNYHYITSTGNVALHLSFDVVMSKQRKSNVCS